MWRQMDLGLHSSWSVNDRGGSLIGKEEVIKKGKLYVFSVRQFIYSM